MGGLLHPIEAQWHLLGPPRWIGRAFSSVTSRVFLRSVDREFLWLIHLAAYGPGDVGLLSTEVETLQVFSSAEEGALRARTQGHFVRK